MVTSPLATAQIRILDRRHHDSESGCKTLVVDSSFDLEVFVDELRAGVLDETEAHFFSMRTCRPVDHIYILDADDTLWDDNVHFERFIERLITAACDHAASLTRVDARRIIDDCERETIPVVGYGPIGFVQSLRKAVTEIDRLYAGFRVEDAFFEEVGALLHSVPHALRDGTEETIRTLLDRGFGVAIYTRGVLDIQAGKIHRSGLLPLVDAVGVVREKSTSDLQRFLHELRTTFGATSFTMVGNSEMSDVGPALACGIAAVHYISDDTWHMERGELPPGVRQIRNLAELLQER